MIFRGRGKFAGDTRSAAGKRGMSMIEVLIAMSVLMIAVLSSLSSQVTSLNLMSSSRESNTAMSDLQAAMEEVLLQSSDVIPDNYPANVSINRFDGRNLQDESIVPSYPGLAFGGPVPDPLSVVLTITWVDFSGRVRTQTLSSMKTK